MNLHYINHYVLKFRNFVLKSLALLSVVYDVGDLYSELYSYLASCLVISVRDVCRIYENAINTATSWKRTK